MSAKVGLYITIEPEHGLPVTLARVNDRQLLTDVALVALNESELLAKQMACEDATLGELQRQEASRLRRALELVIPELRLGEFAARIV